MEAYEVIANVLGGAADPVVGGGVGVGAKGFGKSDSTLVHTRLNISSKTSGRDLPLCTIPKLAALLRIISSSGSLCPGSLTTLKQ